MLKKANFSPSHPLTCENAHTKSFLQIVSWALRSLESGARPLVKLGFFMEYNFFEFCFKNQRSVSVSFLGLRLLCKSISCQSDPFKQKRGSVFYWWRHLMSTCKKCVKVSNDSLWNITFHFCSLVWVSTEYFSIVNMISDSSFWPSWHGMICFIVLVDCANAQKPSVPCFLNEHLQCMWANYDTSLVCCPHPNYKKAIKRWLCTLLPADSFHLKLSYVRCCAE